MRTLLLLALPLGLLACNKEPEPVDNDGDGYDDVFDCDDDDDAVHPDADELCNDIDDNCDGVIDVDAVDKPAWYRDIDADGYGDAWEVVYECDQPSMYVADDTDCDDTDALFHPGAEESDCTDPNDYNCDGSVGWADADGDGFAACEECDDSDRRVNPDALEVCDEIDNDCDGTIDGPSAVDASTWFQDGDGDGFGDAQASRDECEAPEGYVDNDEDCDDVNADVHPDAIEVCDEIDNDCDGTTDGASAADSIVYYADTDGDGYGDETLSTRDCSAPSGYVVDSTDCDDDQASTFPGADETCNEVDDDCDDNVDENAIDASTWYLDADEDGYGASWMTVDACEQPSGFVSDSTDCDDLDDTSYPGGTEVCDDADNDCNGSVDDSPVDEDTWYADDDADGYGDAADSTDACDQPTGYVADATDCDDTSDAAYPGGTEVCDELDNDCDSTVDEADAADASTWYDDDDADGYGDPTDDLDACDQPSGYVSDATDCDDTDSDVNPGADEYCNGDDDDCDGTVDEDDAVDATTTWADVDGDGYGSARFPDTACTPPSGYVSNDEDCDDIDDEINPDADEYCDGVDNDCNGTVDDDYALDALTWYEDADGDGYGDADSTTLACDEPSGYSDLDTDCDDTDATVYDCVFHYFDGTYASSWETLATVSNGCGFQSYHMSADYSEIYNTCYGDTQLYDPSTDSWSTASTSMPYSSAWTQMAPYDGYLWMIRNSRIYQYDPAADSWTTVSSSTGWGDDYNMTESDEYGVIYGYDDAGYVVAYDTITGSTTSWATGLGSEHETRLGYDPGTRSIFFGAYSNANLYQLELDTGTINTMTSIPESQLNDIFCSDRSGHIYAAGGWNGTSMYQYDIATDTWSAIPSLPSSHGNWLTCTVSDSGWLYVTGDSNAFWRLELY